MNTIARKVKGRLRSSPLGAYLRVTDRRLVRDLCAIAMVSVLVSLLEVAAIVMIVPLIELLSGGTLDDAGVPGRLLGQALQGESQQTQTLTVLAIVITLLIIKVVAAAAVRWWTVTKVTRGAVTATARLFAVYLQAPLSFHAHRNSAAASRTAAVSLATVYNAGLLGIATVIVETCTVALIAMLLIVASPLSSIIAAAYFAVAIVIFVRLVQRHTVSMSRARDESYLRELALIQQGIGAIREIRLRGEESDWVDRFVTSSSTRQQLDRRLIFSGEYGRYYIEATFFVGFGLIAAAQILTRGAEAFAALGMMLAAGFRLLPSAGRLLHGMSAIRQGRGSLSVITDELDAVGVDRLDEAVVPLDRPWTFAPPGKPVSVDIDGVTFRYTGSFEDALQDVTFGIPPGGSVGIVGASGSGKSTIVDVICGLVPPTQGEVRIDGRPIGDLSERPRIAYVTQDVFLVEGTVAENVQFSSGPVDEHRLRRALRLAQLTEWVETLPEGVDTPVGERGALVSGGQRQRIGIARALYLEPSLLVLDEATSALDVEIEAGLTSAIDTLGRAVTLIVVAHRLSTVRQCDRILVLEEGRVAGLASFDQLAESNQTFARWVRLAGTAKSPV